MKMIAGLLVAVALFVGIAPQFLDCHSKGRAIELPNGTTVPMKCHWTARAEAVLAAPLLLCAVFLGAPSARQNRRMPALTSILLGIGIILIPTSLIGVCARSDMICSAVMKPTMVLCGVITVAIGGLYFLQEFRNK